MKTLKTLMVILFIGFCFSFLMACSQESSNVKDYSVTNLDDTSTTVPSDPNTQIPGDEGTSGEATQPDQNLPGDEGTSGEATQPDQNLPGDETEPSEGTVTNPENSYAAYRELLTQINEKYNALYEEAVTNFQTAFEVKKAEILGEEYTTLKAQLDDLQSQLDNLFLNFENDEEIQNVKTQFQALVEQLATVEYNSEEYQALVSQLTTLWNTISEKASTLSDQVYELRNQIFTLRTQIEQLLVAHQEELFNARQTLKQDLNAKLSALNEARNVEVNLLRESFSFPTYDGQYRDGRCYDGQYPTFPDQPKEYPSEDGQYPSGPVDQPQEGSSEGFVVVFPQDGYRR